MQRWRLHLSLERSADFSICMRRKRMEREMEEINLCLKVGQQNEIRYREEGDPLLDEKAPPRVLVIIPAHNEERFIGSVVLSARKSADKVIVVDDGSTDDTAQIARDAGAVVVSHKENFGKSAALSTGFALARKLNPAALVTLDGDGQHLPQELLNVVTPVLENQADLVIGSRYLGKECKVPRHRIWGHVFINFITGSLSGITVGDSQSGYRAFSPDALLKMRFHSTGFSVESEMQFLAREAGLRVVEVPITSCYLDKPKRSVFSHGLLVAKGLVNLSERYKPSVFFGVCGSMSLVASFLIDLLLHDHFSDSRGLGLSLNMCDAFLFVIGILGLFAAIILHPIRLWLSDLKVLISEGKSCW